MSHLKDNQRKVIDEMPPLVYKRGEFSWPSVNTSWSDNVKALNKPYSKMFKKILDKYFPKYNDDKRAKEYSEDSESKFMLFKRQSIKHADGSKYLERLILIRCALGGIFFHRIYSTDNDCMHDHPWSFKTILVKGWYIEHYMDSDYYDDPAYPHKQRVKPWRIHSRPENWTHRLEIPEGVKSVWSIVFTSPKKRTWGFLTPRGWQHWKEHPMRNVCE